MNDLDERWNWTTFCGPSGFYVWSSIQHDFGLCFQHLFLHIPVLILFGVFSAFYFGLQTRRISRTKLQKYTILARSSISITIAFMPIFYIILNLYQNDSSPVDKATILSQVVQGITWFSHFLYMLKLRNGLSKSSRGPVPMCIIWSLIFALTILSTRSLYLIRNNVQPIADGVNYYTYVFSIVYCILHIIYAIALIPGEGQYTYHEMARNYDLEPTETQHLLNTYVRFREYDDARCLGVAMEQTHWFSKLFFIWVNKLIKKGIEENINTSEDLYDLPPRISSKCNSEHLGKFLIVESDVEARTATPKYSLFKALHKAYAWEFYSVGLLKLTADCVGFVGPILLNKLVSFIEDKNEDIKFGYFYALGLISSTLLVALCDSHFNFLVNNIGLKMRGAIVMIIYRKTLLVRSTILSSKLSIGEIVNFMSTDTDRIVNSCPSFHSLWSVPFQIIVTLYLLYNQVGLAFLAGLAFSIVLIPINKFIANKIGQLSTKMMEEKDARVKLTSEILKGYKAIKLYVWEHHFIREIGKKRDMELKYLKGRKYLDALCVYFWATTPVIISILTIGTYVLLDNRLTAANMFTTIALLNMLVSPLNAFPWVLNGLTEAWVSVKRIQKLLDLPNMNYGEIYEKATSSEENIHTEMTIVNGTFSLDEISKRTENDNENIVNLQSTDTQIENENNARTSGNNKADMFKLHNINLKINKGEFVAVIGSVGCGKSTLLASILGELSKDSGNISVKDIASGFGIATQQSWLQRGTIRDNILFGESYDEQKYQLVLYACGLNEDMELLPDGDMTGVGDSGGTLSGGQKARIALARAVYQDKPIYLLDDILSAVDVKVAKHIFQHCLLDLLKTKTIILCTHHLKYLSNVDTIVVLEEGKIKNIGTPTNILGSEINTISLDLEINSKEEANLESNENSGLAKSERSTLDKDVLVQETSRKGNLELSVFLSYFKGMGYIVGCTIIIAMIMMQFSRNITDWWIANAVTKQGQNSSDITTLIHETHLFRMDKMTTFLVIYVVFAVANTIFTLMRSFIFAFGGIQAAKSFHKSLLQSVLQGTCSFFDITPSGRIINRFSSDTYTIDDSLPFILNILLAQMFGLLGCLFITVYGLPWICIILIPLVPIYTWLMNQYRLTSRELKRISSVTLSPVYNHFNETLQGLINIRAMRVVHRFQCESEEKLEANLKAQFASQCAARWLGLRLQFISVAIISGVSLIAVIQHQYDTVNPGFIGLALSYALSITGNLAGVINAFTETEREMIAVERVNQYIKTVPPENLYFIMDPPFAWPSQGVVVFENVTLQYRKDLNPSLKNISFTTGLSEKIGIVGRTGAGKSSLISALFRLVDITSGTIYVDCVDVKKISIMALRSRLFCIPQDPFLFTGTIRENLDPLKEFTDNEIWSALEKVNLTNIINSLGGLQCSIKGAGSNFSVGQKQLICLARAVLHNPKILCIDEATANVDEETDKIIQNTLRTAFRTTTVLTIAHRVQTVLDSDRVLVMSQGEIVEFDKPEVLMNQPDSYFFKLVEEN